MPRVHTIHFRVRHYECDPYGHVNNATYLRYMEEAAFRASMAVGYGVDTYKGMNRRWWIHETEVEYLRPLRYGDTAEVRTWVAHARRVRCRRVYEVRRGSTGELAARAWSDWVFLEGTTGRPTAIPEELWRAFGLDDTAKDVPWDRFPEAPPPPPGVFRTRRRVEWRDLDTEGHVNNANYLSYLEDCGVQVATAFGWPVRRMSEAGFAVIARRLRIEYRLPAVLDDELEIATWLSNVRRATAVRHYVIHRVHDGALIARARTLWAWVNLQTGRPIRIPDAFHTDFASNIASA
ncbi:MAG: YbgC/FadM family acyl-CoA thioesterase [Ardenticatenia bacterium]|nr:YbgC/FadM family acyl-CoA thioesterase [Ardenticatenia bacterium]